MNHYHSDHCIAELRRRIESKLAWGAGHDWSNEEYHELSKAILDATGVSLSHTTLKRVWGKVKYTNSPSLTTLNTLARYVGFENWRSFRLHLEAGNGKKRSLRISKPAQWVIIGLVSFSAVLGFGLFGTNKVSESVKENIIFTSNPVTSGFPNSVIFRLKLPEINTENIRIQQYWDPGKTIALRPEQETATGIYYFPGYFRAKLIIEEEVIKEHDLYLKTEGWMATLSDQPIPTYLHDKITFHGTMNVSKDVYQLIQACTAPTFLTYHYVQPFGVSTESFELEASMRNTFSLGPAVCQTAKLFVLCTKGAIIIPLSIPGCVSNINLKVGDYFLSGKEHDLLAFTTDMSLWQKIRLQGEEKKLDVYLNDVHIHRANYGKELGDIAGIRFSFLGAGEVDYLRIWDKDGAEVWNQDFN